MRELNEAYETLAHPEKRNAYDAHRKQHEDDFDFSDEAMRSAFVDAERAQSSDWAVALDYYPDLLEIEKRLRAISDKLAFQYRSTILESKNFNMRQRTADNMEKNFLESFFGKNAIILRFARELIATGNKPAAKELNRVVSVLGSNANPQLIINRIKEKYFKQSSRNHPPIQDLARLVIDKRYVKDAEDLITRLGGTIDEKRDGFFGRVRLFVYLAGQENVFDGGHDMTQWVIARVAPKYI